MDADDHAGHNGCATPGCAAFHLFCDVCAGRYHLRDRAWAASAQADPTPARNTVPAPVSVMARPAAANTA
jgi:hypothetical protein